MPISSSHKIQENKWQLLTMYYNKTSSGQKEMPEKSRQSKPVKGRKSFFVIPQCFKMLLYYVPKMISLRLFGFLPHS
jgi:hypothetical protein